ncbi:MAG: YjjG family noncanonical pyrimidine nucleotidase [Sphingobacteriaceae bacterium]
MKYRHIFFDLDHTLWDFDKNASETLQELYIAYGLKKIGLPSADLFIETYTRNNHQLWADYHLGKITKEVLRETRFKKTFTDLGLSPELIPLAFEQDYVMICPTKKNLFPHAHETLQYLHGKYNLHLISNGFREATEMKITSTDLGKYFQNIIISEIVGINKPDKAIYAYAFKQANALHNQECIMIGDSLEADVRGALNFGIDAIYFNPLNLETPADIPLQITHLRELIFLL